MQENQAAALSSAEPKRKKVPFSTKDLNEAAFLWCQDGVNLLRVEGESEGRGITVYFVMSVDKTEEELRQLMFDYRNGNTMVEPQRYIQQQNNLRDMLHSSLARTRRQSRGEKG